MRLEGVDEIGRVEANSQRAADETSGNAGGNSRESEQDQASGGDVHLTAAKIKELVGRRKWNSKDKKKFLAHYGFASWSALCDFRAAYLDCEKAYQPVLRNLDALGLKNKAALDAAIANGTLKTDEEKKFRVKDRDYSHKEMKVLAARDGEDFCVELAMLVSPMPEGNAERVQAIKHVFGAQNALRMKDGKMQNKNQYYGKMRSFIAFCLTHRLDNGDGTSSACTLPFSKHVYVVEYIKSRLEFGEESGEVYSASTILHHIQACNQIWAREAKMFPDLVTWCKPGEAEAVKQLRNDSKIRKVANNLKSYKDRGLEGHLNELTEEDLLKSARFILQYDPNFREQYTADEFRQMGLKISTDPDLERKRMSQLRRDLKEFDSYYDLLLHGAMNNTQSNTYVRAQQVRGFGLPDTSVVETGKNMGTTHFPNFTPCKLVGLQINNSKNQNGSQVKHTYVGRHLDVEQCGTASISFYTVYSYSDVQGENTVRQVPDLSVNRKWYNEVLFCEDVREPEKTMTHSDQADDVKRMNKILGIETTSVTHALRKLMDLNPAPLKDVSRLALYQSNLGEMEKVYIKKPAYRAIRGRTGFPWQGSEWYLPRQSLWIDDLSADPTWSVDRSNKYHLMRIEERTEKAEDGTEKKVKITVRRADYYLLVLEIFPFLPELKKVFDPVWIAENPEETYKAAQGFVSFLEYMAIVFLQDAVFLRPKYPEFILYQHRVFEHALWDEFSTELLEICNSNEAHMNFRAASEHFPPEIQIELKKVYQAVAQNNHEMTGIKTTVHKALDSIATKMGDLAASKTDLQKKLNSQIEQSNHLQRLQVAQRKEIHELKETSNEILRLLKANSAGVIAGGRDQSSATTSAASLGSQDSRLSHASPKLLSPVSLKSLSPLQPPTAKSKVTSAAFDLDQAQRKLFNEGKPFTIPPMKSTPREVFNAYYKKKFGEMKGLMEVEEQANILRIRDKAEWLKSPLLEALAVKKKKDLTKLMEGVVTRHRQLKRVAIMYKKIYDDLSPSIHVPAEQSSRTAEYIHEEVFKEFHKKGIELGGLSANYDPRKNSLQNLCVKLQRLDNPERKAGRKSTKRPAENETCAATPDENLRPNPKLQKTT